jgi:uncharacterized protein YjbI with pentapeptide repeats
MALSSVASGGRTLQEFSADEAMRFFASARRGGELADAIFPRQFAWPRRKTAGVCFRNVEFRSPFIGTGLFGRYRVSACVFEDCTLDGLKTNRAAFADCRLERTTFGPRLYGHLSRTQFQDCALRDCSFTHVEWYDCQLHNCCVEGGRMTDIIFRNCRIEGVKLSARLRKVNFIHCCVSNADFSEAEFYDSGFVECFREKTRLPDHPRNFAIPSAALLQAKPTLRQRLSSAGYRQFAEIADIDGASGMEEIIDPETFDDLTEDENHIVMEVLYEMKRAGPKNARS